MLREQTARDRWRRQYAIKRGANVFTGVMLKPIAFLKAAILSIAHARSACVRTITE